MPSDPKLDLLHSVPLFARLGRREMLRLSQLADEIDVDADRVLVRQGDHASEMFVIVAGHRTATVTTTEPTRLFVLGQREFHGLMDEMPSGPMSVLECVADRIRGLESSAAH